MLLIHTSTSLADFGSIRMGTTDNALDRMDGALPENMDLEGLADSNVAGAIGGDETGITYMSPSFNGITVYGSTTAEGATTGFGANYKAGAVEVMFQTGSEDQTAVAGKFSAGAVTVQVGAVNVGSGASRKSTARLAQATPWATSSSLLPHKKKVPTSTPTLVQNTLLHLV